MVHTNLFAVVLRSERVKEKAAASAPFSYTFGPQPVIPCLFRSNEKSSTLASCSLFQTSALTDIQLFRKLAGC